MAGADNASTDSGSRPVVGDLSVPSPARMYDYLLGGTSNHEIDRAVVDKVLEFVPDAGTAARQNRRFLAAAVDLAARSGVRQFIDLGCGIPTAPNTHEVARAVDPSARVVYVDNDPLVKEHNDRALQGDPGVVTLRADARDAAAILAAPEVTGLIDFDRPIALMLIGLLHFVPDDENPLGIIEAFRERMAPGSHLLISHMSSESDANALAVFQASGENNTFTARFRDRDEVRPFFAGFELLDPGVRTVPEWLSAAGIEAEQTGLVIECGIAATPSSP